MKPTQGSRKRQRQGARILWALSVLVLCAPAVAQSGPILVRMSSIGEFYAQSYSRHAHQPQSGTTRRGTAQDGDLFLVIQPQAVSSKLAEASASGRHISEAVIQMSSSSEGRDRVMTMRLREVVITSFGPSRNNVSGAAGELQQVGLSYETIQTSWKSHRSPFAPEPMGRSAGSAPSAAPDTAADTVTDKDDPYRVTMTSIPVFAARSWSESNHQVGASHPDETRRKSVATYGDVTLVMKKGPASPKIADALATGRHISKAVIEWRTAMNGREKIMRITLKNVEVSRIEASGSNLEKVDLAYESMKRSVTDTGNRAAPPPDARRKRE